MSLPILYDTFPNLIESGFTALKLNCSFHTHPSENPQCHFAIRLIAERAYSSLIAELSITDTGPCININPIEKHLNSVLQFYTKCQICLIRIYVKPSLYNPLVSKLVHTCCSNQAGCRPQVGSYSSASEL